MSEVDTKILVDCGHDFDVFFGRWNRGRKPNNRGIKDGMAASIGKEWSHFCCRNYRVVVSELTSGEEGAPVILLVRAENTKVLFNDLIDDFRGAIGLRVEGRREIQVDSK
jgi:hypothetical protein